MTNEIFASLLAKAVENKKLASSKLVDEFVETHEGDATNIPNTIDTESTPEITSFIDEMRKRRIKIKDSQLNSLINDLAAAPVAEKVVKTSRSSAYKAQEW